MTPDHDAVEGEGPRGHSILCRLPVALYEWMRLNAFQERCRMQSIILEGVEAYRVEWEAGHATREGRVLAAGEIVKYNLRLDDDPYEWLRTTAFHARTSINALVVAALACAHADYSQGQPRPMPTDDAPLCDHAVVSPDPDGLAHDGGRLPIGRPYACAWVRATFSRRGKGVD